MSFVSASLNATNIAVMKDSHWPTWMVGPEFLFSINKCYFCGFFCARWLHNACFIVQLALHQRGFVGQAAGPEVAPPIVFYGHNVIQVRCVGSAMASSASRYYRKGHFCDQFQFFTVCAH